MHVNEGPCQSCQEKLTQCHSTVVDLYNFIKNKHYDAHIAWSFRDQTTQNQLVAQGKSRQPWDQSPHNHTENGQPCSLAIDLFQLTDAGQANFAVAYYQQIWNDLNGTVPNVNWGGNYIHLKDYDHFYITLT